MLECKSEEISIAFMVIQRLFAIERRMTVAKLLKSHAWPCCHSYLPEGTFLYTYPF